MPSGEAARAWTELQIHLPFQLSDNAAELLVEMGSKGVWVRSGATEPREGGASELAAYFDSDADSERIRKELARNLRTRVEVRVVEVPEEDWAGAWRKHFRPVPFAPGVWVAPPRMRLPDRARGTKVVRVLPGMAFGTGTHPTTRMCARAMLRVLRFPGGRARGREAWDLLDVGTGSGILAIAAEVTGLARRILAIDTDPLAVREVGENAHRSHVRGPAVAVAGPEGVRGPFRVVVANLTGPILIALAPELARLVRPGGRLVISGFLREERDRVERELERAGLTVVGRRNEREWGCAWLAAPASKGERQSLGPRR